MSGKQHVLIVEDDSNLREALCVTLECAGHKVAAAADGPAALELLTANEFSIVVSDLRMQPMDGISLLKEIRNRIPQLPVLLMTAFGDVDKAVQAMRAGACDFLLKPFEPETLLLHVERYGFKAPQCEGLIAEDRMTLHLLGLAARVARSDVTVLLTGESGTGKEVFARYVHQQSPRAAAPFVAINCAAIPENLLEATLFGYEKGAFTGAANAQAGKFEQAENGTLLLDEISEMPLALQAKLLRVLQEREVERVGGKKPVAVNIRIVATSNRDMAAEVRAGRFREDLFYRLNVFPLEIPSLRERRADIVPLARHFLANYAGRAGKTAILSAAAMAALADHDWPGNVRELENTVQRALILAPADTVEPEHLFIQPARLATGIEAPRQAPALDTPMTAAQAESMKDLERRHILDTLAAVGGSRRRAVEKLGISERTLRYKLQQYRQEGTIA